ncbi:hypothetical protein GCM10011506_38750 [Marivirga lumbricoides]|uniref:Uncharacterized protein n=1 Tax=Marivirga lumbricoides TaxID=1046115 RepID=A0ABQ1MY88_9BACT|nr:hypothetical protein GCM10011506_38750 [Marivirga lumbricoides]
MGQRGVLAGFTTMGNMISVLLKNIFSKFPIAQFTAKAIGYIEAMYTKGKVVMVWFGN